MWAAVTIKVVDPGTEITEPNGTKHIVTDNNAVRVGRVMHVTKWMYEALRDASETRRAGQGGNHG